MLVVRVGVFMCCLYTCACYFYLRTCVFVVFTYMGELVVYVCVGCTCVSLYVTYTMYICTYVCTFVCEPNVQTKHNTWTLGTYGTSHSKLHDVMWSDRQSISGQSMVDQRSVKVRTKKMADFINF